MAHVARAITIADPKKETVDVLKLLQDGYLDTYKVPCPEGISMHRDQSGVVAWVMFPPVDSLAGVLIDFHSKEPLTLVDIPEGTTRATLGPVPPEILAQYQHVSRSQESGKGTGGSTWQVSGGSKKGKPWKGSKAKGKRRKPQGILYKNNRGEYEYVLFTDVKRKLKAEENDFSRGARFFRQAVIAATNNGNYDPAVDSLNTAAGRAALARDESPTQSDESDNYSSDEDWYDSAHKGDIYMILNDDERYQQTLFKRAGITFGDKITKFRKLVSDSVAKAKAVVTPVPVVPVAPVAPPVPVSMPVQESKPIRPEPLKIDNLTPQQTGAIARKHLGDKAWAAVKDFRKEKKTPEAPRPQEAKLAGVAIDVARVAPLVVAFYHKGSQLCYGTVLDGGIYTVAHKLSDDELAHPLEFSFHPYCAGGTIVDVNKTIIVHPPRGCPAIDLLFWPLNQSQYYDVGGKKGPLSDLGITQMKSGAVPQSGDEMAYVSPDSKLTMGNVHGVVPTRYKDERFPEKEYSYEIVNNVVSTLIDSGSCSTPLVSGKTGQIVAIHVLGPVKNGGKIPLNGAVPIAPYKTLLKGLAPLNVQTPAEKP
jgi:hypothetical protein